MREEQLFSLQADVTFYAKDIDDVFLRLSKHYKGLYVSGIDNEDDIDLQSGIIEIYPIKREK